MSTPCRVTWKMLEKKYFTTKSTKTTKKISFFILPSCSSCPSWWINELAWSNQSNRDPTGHANSQTVCKHREMNYLQSNRLPDQSHLVKVNQTDVAIHFVNFVLFVVKNPAGIGMGVRRRTGSQSVAVKLVPLGHSCLDIRNSPCYFDALNCNLNA